MAEILDARVKQKTGVAADFAGFTLLEGEFALVRSSSDGPVINYKVGPGLFDSLPWSLQVPGTVASVSPSTDFDALPAGLYLPDSDGTYDGTVAVDLTEGVTYLNWDGSTLTKQVYPINLSGYTPITDFNTVKSEVNNITETGNLLDKSTVTAGYYAESSGLLGSVASNNTLKVLITGIKGNTAYTFQPNATTAAADRFLWVKNGNEVISKVAPIAGSSHTVTSPADATALAINIGTIVNIGSQPWDDNVLSNAAQLVEGSTPLPYRPYGTLVKGSAVYDFQVGFPVLVSGQALTGGGSIWRTDNGIIADLTSVGYPNAGRYTNLFPVVPGDRILYSGNVGGTSGIAGYAANGTYHATNGRILDSTITGTNVLTDYEVIIPTGVYLIGVSTRDSVNNPIVLKKYIQGEINTVLQELAETEASDSAAPVKIVGITATKFEVHSLCGNGEYLIHEFERLTKTDPQEEDGWYSTNIKHNGNTIIQGAFNWIHMINRPNEGQHVGIGHGCEVFIDAKWWIGGKLFDPANIIGQTLTGDRFSFSWTSIIYAADAAASPDGANVVPQRPLIPSTRHHLHGTIERDNLCTQRNKLVILRDGTTFARSYAGMLAGYFPYFNRMQYENIENTINQADINGVVPISPYTATLQGYAIDTADGERGELASVAHMWSTVYPYKISQEVYNHDNSQQRKMYILSDSGNPATNRNKLYFIPVVTSEIAARAGLPADSFDIGDYLECSVIRKISIY